MRNVWSGLMGRESSTGRASVHANALARHGGSRSVLPVSNVVRSLAMFPRKEPEVQQANDASARWPVAERISLDIQPVRLWVVRSSGDISRFIIPNTPRLTRTDTSGNIDWSWNGGSAAP